MHVLIFTEHGYIGSLPFLKFWLRLKCKKFAFRLLQELKKTSNPIYSYSFQRKIYTSILIAKKIIGTPMAFSVLRLFEIYMFIITN